MNSADGAAGTTSTLPAPARSSSQRAACVQDDGSDSYPPGGTRPAANAGAAVQTTATAATSVATAPPTGRAPGRRRTAGRRWGHGTAPGSAASPIATGRRTAESNLCRLRTGARGPSSSAWIPAAHGTSSPAWPAPSTATPSSAPISKGVRTSGRVAERQAASRHRPSTATTMVPTRLRVEVLTA